MYVIFPADELVYLSYGRLIYVPSVENNNSYEAQIAASFTNTPNPSITAHQPRSEDRAPLRRIKRENLISSSRTAIVTGAPDDDDFSATNKLAKRKSKTPTKSREHSPNNPKAKISPSTSVKSSNSSSQKTPPIPAIVTTSVCTSKSFIISAQPDPAKYQTGNHLQLPSSSTCSSRSPRSDKRLSYSDFLPIHKCLKEAEEQQQKKVLDKAPVAARKVAAPANSVRDSKRLFSEQLSDLGSHTVAPLPSGKQSPIKRGTIFGKTKKASEQLGVHTTNNMATMSSESALKELTHPNYNESLKLHNGVTFKLIRTVSDFTQQLAEMYEQHAEELQLLVSNFRKKNGELRKERPACPSSLYHTWETLLQEVEIDGQALGDIASILGRQVSRQLLEKSFYRKIQSRKVFTHRESYETIISKTEEKLAKCRLEYKSAYLLYLSSPTTDSLSGYFNSHNAYVQQLHATNGMLEAYHKGTLPQLLQELEEIYSDLCSTISESVLQGAEVVSARALEQCKRYDGLVSQCRTVNGPGDLAHVARSLAAPQGRPSVMRRPFVPPQPPPPTTPDPGNESGPLDDAAVAMQNDSIPPPLKDELVIDRLSAVQVRPSHDALRKEAADLEAQIRQIQDALDTMLRLQQRSVESQLFNKANEIQEDISMKTFDLRVAQIHLSAINAQKELFSNKLETGDAGRERKMSNASTGSMKTKWLKAFKSLKTPPPETEKKNGSAAATRELLKGDPDAHNFQEYTYKKITPCDICSQVLRGHTRQGLRCRICKMNVHMDCQNKVGKCQTKAKLLRRQKSTSEIETKMVADTTEEDISEHVNSTSYTSRISTMNRQLSVREVSTGGYNNRQTPPSPTGGASGTIDRRSSGLSGGGGGGAGPGAGGTPESSMRRRIFAGMKSLTGFGSRSRQSSPGHRSISLPEKRKSTDASGTRPFGQPLMLLPQLENGDFGYDCHTPPSPSPSKGKITPPIKAKVQSKQTLPKKNSS